MAKVRRLGFGGCLGFQIGLGFSGPLRDWVKGMGERFRILGRN